MRRKTKRGRKKIKKRGENQEGRGRRQMETDGQKGKCGKTYGKRELKGQGEERRYIE